MSIRFIVGRAGSGKTHRCLEQLRARLRESPADGNRLLLLVPEQASFQMERALIETPDLPGFTRCEVVSFHRLALRIFAEAGAKGVDQTIGGLGRLMLIRRLIRQERSSLRLLARVADKPGLVKQVAVALEELMREQVGPETLADVADQAGDDDPLQAAKLADLARLYRAYLDALLDNRTDPAQYLSLAAERIVACPTLRGAEVWVDGFAGFTAQEYELLVRLAGVAANVEIALLVDPDTPAVHADSIPAWSYSLFSRTERTIVKLRRLLSAAGLRLDEPVRLANPKPSRFAHPDLAVLEANLFGRIHARPGRTVDAAGAAAGGAVRVLELPDRRGEVRAAIAEIERLRRRAVPPMRYRDVAVIVRDLGPYHDLLSAELKAHDIPCFLDRRQPTTQHPLVELVRGLLAVAADDCRLESVRLVLKTGLLPIARDDADLLENYLLAHGITGRSAWDEPWHYTRLFRRRGEADRLRPDQAAALERVNQVRRQWLDAMGEWLQAAVGPREAAGRAWARALYGCLERLHVPERLFAWADDAERAGRPDEADAHRQVWSDFVELLDEFVRALGSEAMKVREFQETLEAGLAEFSLGLAPATLDQVLVGAIERSRHPPVRAVILLGFDDRHFPMRRGEDPLLGDDERRALERAGAEIGPPRDRQLLDERMLAYIALTRASERVVITYPRSESDGQPVQASPYLRDVLAALPGLAVETPPDGRAERRPEGLTRPGELGAWLASEFRYRPEPGQDPDPARRGRWNALYLAARERAEWRPTLVRSLAGLKYRNVAEPVRGRIGPLIGRPFAASVSRLERFAACPFAHFVEYFLKLEPRIEADMRDVDLGNLCHAILEKVIGELADAGGRLADLEDDDISDRVARAADAVVPLISDDVMTTQARNAFLLSRGREHLRRVLRWQRNGARVGAYRPCRVEYPFGYSDDPGAQLRLVTPKGREVVLRGRIDRVDLAELGGELLGLVIDYKHTTDRRLDLAKVYHGLALQLVGYLLALQQTGASLAGRPIRPVAAFYLPLLEPFRTVAHPSEEKTTTYLWRGIADASALATLDRTVVPGGQSQFLSARLNRDGRPHPHCDLARGEDFAALMRHVLTRMSELADQIIDGEVAVAPYRLNRKTPCSFCEYRPVCRYEIETQPPRTLEALRKADVFERLNDPPTTIPNPTSSAGGEA
ncbi:MAG: hypothetical protein AMXMBFR83_03690 [Phycisphaerae bacterium]